MFVGEKASEAKIQKASKSLIIKVQDIKDIKDYVEINSK
jgi:hypothetical protein